jgi:uncharacterized protein
VTAVEFLVFGASGRTGGAFVEQALQAGHAVSAFVRQPTSVAGVDVRVGDVLDAASVRAAVPAGATIVVALGGIEALTVGTANIVSAATAAGARRVLGVVGAGVLQADAHRRRHELPDYPARFRPIGAAHEAFHAALRGSSLDWTLACTPNLVDGPANGPYAATADYLPEGTGRIPFATVAAFLLDVAVDERADRRFARMRVGLNGR